jgi:hypothetical protein
MQPQLHAAGPPAAGIGWAAQAVAGAAAATTAAVAGSGTSRRPRTRINKQQQQQRQVEVASKEDQEEDSSDDDWLLERAPAVVASEPAAQVQKVVYKVGCWVCKLASHPGGGWTV